jgi:hypothetical protein
MKKSWDVCAKIFIDETLFATIRVCDNTFCYYAPKTIDVDGKAVKRSRRIDFSSLDTAYNELVNDLEMKYNINANRIFMQKT